MNYSLVSRVSLVCVMIVILFSACSIIKPIEFKGINHFSVQEQAGSIIFSSNLSLYNPNGFNFLIDNANIDVYAEGVSLGKLQIPDTILIENKEVFTGDFKVEINLVKLLLVGKNVLPKLRSGKVEIELKGYIDADVLWISKRFDVYHKEKIGIKL